MFHLSQRFKSVIMMFLVAILVLAACGGDDEVVPTSAPATGSPTEVPAAPESPLQPESPLSASNAANAGSSGAVANSPTPSEYTMAAPEFAMSQAAMGTVVGRLVSTITEQPLNHEIVRLAEVECPEDVAPENKRTECISVLSNAFSPSTFTDENGFFVFNDVNPRDYVVIVGDMMGKNTNLADEDGPFMWEAAPDEITDIGEFQIEW